MKPAAVPEFPLYVSRGFFIRLLLLASVLLVVVYARHVVLVAFAGVLLAIVLRALASYLQRLPFVNARWSYPLLLILIVALTAVLGYVLGPRIITEAHDIVQEIPQSAEKMVNALNRYEWGRDISLVIERSVQSQQISAWTANFATASVEIGIDGIAIIAIALFLASNPPLYRRGLLYLVPKEHRAQAADLLNDIASCLKGWLLGQLIPMTALGIATLVGLWLLGIPLAFTLGLFTGLMLFVPYAGAVMAYIPAALMAFTKGPAMLFYVTILYLGVHTAEGYVITPLAQRYAIRLPPALTLVSQLFMWKFAGLLGVLVATPLTAVCLVVAQKIFVDKGQELRT